MTLALPLLVFPALKVIPGGIQETLGPLFQMTARCAVMYPDDSTDAERKTIDAVLPYDSIAQRYNPTNEDQVKFWFRYDSCTRTDLVSYLGTWLAQGLRHPDSYIEATLAIAAPYLNATQPITIIDYTGDVAHNGSDKLHQPTYLKPFREALVGIYNMLASIPVLSVLFSSGLYVWIIPTLAFLSLIMSRSRYSAVFIVVGLSMLVCVFSPIYDGRYALHLIEIAPIIIVLALLGGRQRQSRSAR